MFDLNSDKFNQSFSFQFCDVINPSLDRYFPQSSGVRIIAEPGRLFVASAVTLAVKIIGKRNYRPTVASEKSGNVIFH